MRTIRYLNHLDYVVEIQNVGISDGFTLYLVGYGKRQYMDHKWVLSSAISRAYEILDSVLVI